MRPRYLIQLCDECFGHANASGNDRIEVADFVSGFKNYSQDIIGNTNFEMRDVVPETADAIYALIGLRRKCTLNEVKEALEKDGFGPFIDKVIELFFWFAILGAKTPNGEEKYIYNYRYDMKLFSKMRQTEHAGEETVFVNPAFATGLDCVDLC